MAAGDHHGLDLVGVGGLQLLDLDVAPLHPGRRVTGKTVHL